MKLTDLNRLSILSCSTGLALAAIVFVVLGFGQEVPEWLPMAVASIAGFELFFFAQEIARRRKDGHG